MDYAAPARQAEPAQQAPLPFGMRLLSDRSIVPVFAADAQVHHGAISGVKLAGAD
jgi:hypothetical protein